MVIRILAVENELKDYRNLDSLLKSMLKGPLSEMGVDDLHLDRAESAGDAEALLTGALEQSNPYHILILDLQIPGGAGRSASTEHGFDILKLARRLSAARQIIIYTKFPEGINIQTALREGANDFVKKPTQLGVNDYELKTRFMCCWQRVLNDESSQLLDLRVKDLIPYAEAGLAHRFTAHFFDLVQTVTYTAHDIEQYASERFVLDRKKDSQDYLFRLLNRQDAGLKAAQENWAALNADLSSGDETPKAEILETLFDAVEEKLAPCALVKNTPIRKDFYGGAQTRILSFPDEVRVVIQEIISGALSVLTDFGMGHKISVGLRLRNGQAELQFSDDIGCDDDLARRRADAQAINGGFPLSPNHGTKRFGRAWGLSVVQHIALRGGGRLIVMPQPQGTQITYVIPVAQ